VLNRIAAVVNDEIITLFEVEQESAPLLAMMEPDTLPQDRARKVGEIKKQVLMTLVRDKLFEQEMRKLGVEISDIEVDNYLKFILKQQRVDEDQLRRILAREGKTMGEYRELIRKKISREQYLQYRLKASGLDVTEEEIKDYYNRHPDEFRNEAQVTLAEIRFDLPAGADPALALEVKGRAEQAYGRILAGEPFEEMARRYSSAASASRGGLLGTFRVDSELKPSYSRVARSMKSGEVSAIGRDPDGYFILKILERIESEPRPLSEEKERIRNILYNQKVDRQVEVLTDELYRKSFVDIRVEDF